MFNLSASLKNDGFQRHIAVRSSQKAVPDTILCPGFHDLYRIRGENTGNIPRLTAQKPGKNKPSVLLESFGTADQFLHDLIMNIGNKQVGRDMGKLLCFPLKCQNPVCEMIVSYNFV